MKNTTVLVLLAIITQSQAVRAVDFAHRGASGWSAAYGFSTGLMVAAFVVFLSRWPR